MFKKAVKKQVIKFDEDDDSTIEAANSNGREKTEEESEPKLDIRALKGNKKKSNKMQGISFEEEKPVIEFSQKKKLLYQPPSNTENENNYESKPIGQTSSHQAYLDELRKLNQKANESALEYMKNVKEMEDFGYDEPIQEEKYEMNLVDIEKQEPDELDDNQLKEIQEAKKYREKRRVLNSGDYIPLKQDNEDFDDIMTTRKTNRISMNVLKDSPERRPQDLVGEDLDPEEEEAVHSWENQILKRAINSKTMSNINNFLSKQYASKTGEIRTEPRKRIMAKEIDVEFILRTLEENIKTNQANYDYDVERITQLMNWISLAEDNIQNYQKQYDENSKKLETFQDIMDYMNDITDCICKQCNDQFNFEAEKIEQIDEAENTLEKIEIHFSEHFFEKIALDISDRLEENGGQPIHFDDEELNSKRKSQKNHRAQQRRQQDEKIASLTNIKSTLSDNVNSLLNLDEDEVLQNLKYDKAAIYLAAKDIFDDVVEDYTDVKIISKQMIDFKQACEIDDEKMVEWFTELVNQFIRIDLIGYDPIGYTDKEHRFHGIESFLELPGLSDLSTPQLPDQSGETNPNLESVKLMRDVMDKLLGSLVKDKLLNIVKYLWNPFSPLETKKLASSINKFIQIYYVNNQRKDQQHLEKIKEILQSVTQKLKMFLEILKFPPVSRSSFGYYIYALSINILKSVLQFQNILPLSNIAQISLETILLGKICNAAKDLNPDEQIFLLSYVIEFLPKELLNNEKIKINLDSLKQLILSAAQSIENEPEKYQENKEELIRNINLLKQSLILN